jgi:hypothetical protein
MMDNLKASRFHALFCFVDRHPLSKRKVDKRRTQNRLGFIVSVVASAWNFSVTLRQEQQDRQETNNQATTKAHAKPTKPKIRGKPTRAGHT